MTKKIKFSSLRLFRFCVLLLIAISIHCIPVLAETSTARETFSRLAKGVEKFTLSNGMRVLFYRRPQAPIFTGQVWVKVGGVDEVPGQTGVSHMLEHMAFKGSKTIGTKDYALEKVLLSRLDELMAGKSVPDKEDAKEVIRLQKELESLWGE